MRSKFEKVKKKRRKFKSRKKFGISNNIREKCTIKYFLDFERLDSACSLDVGSPLVCVHDNRPFLYGFVSHSYQCGVENYPAILAKVVSYLGWINENMFVSTTADIDEIITTTIATTVQEDSFINETSILT